MFRLRCIVRNILRRKRQNSILIVSIALLSLLFIVSYAFKASNAEKIESFYENFKVTAEIVQNENVVDYEEYDWLRKSLAERITSYTDFIESYNYKKDEEIYVYPTKEIVDSFFDTLSNRDINKGTLSPLNFGLIDAAAYGRTNLSIDLDLADVPIEFADGYDESHFSADNPENILIINKMFSDMMGIQIGDTMLIGEKFEHIHVSGELLEAEKRAVKEFLVVGIFELNEQNRTVYMPLNNVVYLNAFQMFYQNEVKYDGAFYILKQADILNEFKQQLLDDRAVANELRFIIYDDAMTQILEPLLSSNHFINIGISILYVVVVLIGFILSFIILKTRVHEMAIDISIGVSYRYIFLVLFFEFLMLCLCGIILGTVAGFLITSQPLYGAALVYFVVAFSFGTALSILSTLRIKPIAVLTQKD